MSSPLQCQTCFEPVDTCTCPDIDERLRSSVMDPDGHVLFKWCRACDKHYARCRCRVPQFVILCGGKEVDPVTLRDITGRRPNIDLHPDSEKKH